MIYQLGVESKNFSCFVIFNTLCMYKDLIYLNWSKFNETATIFQTKNLFFFFSSLLSTHVLVCNIHQIKNFVWCVIWTKNLEISCEEPSLSSYHSIHTSWETWIFKFVSETWIFKFVSAKIIHRVQKILS